MADSGTGIKELMSAETRASQIVAEARTGAFPSLAAAIRRPVQQLHSTYILVSFPILDCIQVAVIA